MGLVGGVSAVGALALAAGEPTRIAKSSQDALAALDSNYLQSAGAQLDSMDEYRASQGVKLLPVGQPKYTVNNNVYQRFDSTWLMTSNVEDWYVTNKSIAKVDPSFYTLLAGYETKNGTSIPADMTLGAQVSKQYLTSDKAGWSLLDQTFFGAVGVLTGYPQNATYPATPGMGVPTDVLWPTNVNQPARGYQSWKPLVKPEYQVLGVPKYEVTDPTQMNNIIKKVVMMFGGDLVRVAKLDRRWMWTTWYDYTFTHQAHPFYFTDEPGCPTDANGQAYTVPTILDDGTQIVPAAMQYVVSIGMGEQANFYDAVPEPFAHVSNLRTYSRMTNVGVMLATFIRGLGYNAIPMLNDTGAHIPIALDAGIGEQSRIDGRVSTPEFGTLTRVYALITDLPMSLDNPVDFQMTEFCTDCKKCAIACPGKALSLETDMTDGTSPNDINAPIPNINTAGKTTWYGNRLNCVHGTALVGNICAICKRACPWNHVSNPWHDRGKWAAINLGSTGRAALLDLYDAFGYGQEVPATKWWNEPVKRIAGYSHLRDTEE